MKKFICALLAILMIAALTACGTDADKNVTSNEVEKENSDISETASTSETIDVDLTKLSSTMVYSEVYGMLTNPSDYIGKTVKMNGQFAMYHDEALDQYYFACVIADATACCQQGLEFVLAGDYTYPDDYPALDSEITVIGEFQTYMEGTQQYCHLTNAEFID